jgi:hypothetical protein
LGLVVDRHFQLCAQTRAGSPITAPDAANAQLWKIPRRDNFKFLPRLEAAQENYNDILHITLVFSIRACIPLRRANYHTIAG